MPVDCTGMLPSAWWVLRSTAMRCIRRPLWATLVVIVTALAVGPLVGLTLLAHELLRSPLAYPHFERLFQLGTTADPQTPLTYELAGPELLSLREQLAVADTIAGWRLADRVHTSASRPEPTLVRVAEVTSGLLDLLSDSPAMGRFFTKEEELNSSFRPLVMTWEQWQREGLGDHEVDTYRLQLDGEAFTVVGVLPQGFSLGEDDAHYFVPVSPAPAFHHEDIGGVVRPVVTVPRLKVIGRARPGVSIRQVNDSLVAAALVSRQRHVTVAEPLRDRLTRTDVRLAQIALAGLALFAAIAVSTLIHLYAAKFERERRTFEIARSLGATTWHLWRQMAGEAVLLGCAAAVLAIGLAHVLLAAATQVLPAASSLRLPASISGMHALIVVAGCIACVLSLASLFTIRISSHWQTSPQIASPQMRRAGMVRRDVVLVSQTATAGSLVAVLFALLSTSHALLSSELGFDPKTILTLRLPLTAAQQDAAPAEQFFPSLLESLRQLPGVHAVAIADTLPVVEARSPMDVAVIGGLTTGRVPAMVRVVSRDYAAAVGLSVVASASVDVPRGVMVNAEFARRYLAQGSTFNARLDFYLKEWPIVGVLSDATNPFADEPTVPEIYCLMEDIASLHRPVRTQWATQAAVIVQTTATPQALLPLIHDRIRALDATIPLTQVSTMQSLVDQKAVRTTSLAWFFGALSFSGLALVMASLASVTFISLRARTREIGIRFAVGMTAPQAWLLLLRGAVVTSAIGGVIAFAMSHAVVGLIQAYDPQAPEMTPWLWGAAASTLMAGALLAALPAATLVARIDPAVALRHE